eukprot:14603138-Alexandrium_andersonii.AAC.1
MAGVHVGKQTSRQVGTPPSQCVAIGMRRADPQGQSLKAPSTQAAEYCLRPIQTAESSFTQC